MLLLQISAMKSKTDTGFASGLASLEQEILKHSAFGQSSAYAFFENKLMEYYGGGKAAFPRKSDYETIPKIKKQADLFLAWVKKNPDLLDRFKQEMAEAKEQLKDTKYFEENGTPILRAPKANEVQALFDFWVGVKYAESEFPKIVSWFYPGRALALIDNSDSSNAAPYGAIVAIGSSLLLQLDMPALITTGMHERGHVSGKLDKQWWIRNQVSYSEAMASLTTINLYLPHKISHSSSKFFGPSSDFYSAYLDAKDNKRSVGGLMNSYGAMAVYPWLANKVNVDKMSKYPGPGYSLNHLYVYYSAVPLDNVVNFNKVAKNLCADLGITDNETAKKLALVFATLSMYYKGNDESSSWQFLEKYVELMNKAFGTPAGSKSGYADLKSVPKKKSDNDPSTT